MEGVICNCSPAVTISRRLVGTAPELSATSANCCKATKGRNSLSTAFSLSNRIKAAVSRRTSSEIKTNVPPEHQVEKISWKETSKLTGANCRVLASLETVVFCSCHKIRLVRGRCLIATPLGFPEDPYV